MAISIVAALATMVSGVNAPTQARLNPCDDGDFCVRGGEGQKGGGFGGQFSVNADPFTDSEKGGAGHEGGGHFEYDENSGATKCVGKLYQSRC